MPKFNIMLKEITVDMYTYAVEADSLNEAIKIAEEVCESNHPDNRAEETMSENLDHEIVLMGAAHEIEEVSVNEPDSFWDEDEELPPL